MSKLIDQPERDRFELGHDINISVIAPAGVGKTTSIVNRIVHLAKLPEAEAVERLQRLVVVTYSVRAAQQMQQRARVAIRDAAVSNRVQRAFQQTFFGTIHSFCVRLLDRFGHYLGLPSPTGLVQDEQEIWRRFLLRGLDSALGSDDDMRELFHFYSPEQLYSLGLALPPGDEIPTSPLPEPDVERLLRFDTSGLHAATKKSIVKVQVETATWADAWKRGERFRPLPRCPDSDKAAAYLEIYRETFAPLHTWLHDTARAFGRSVANAYERFRLSEAVMTYDDQVRLALRVLMHPAAQRELMEERYSVLLDEAQDTDPLQFEVLRRVAGISDHAEQHSAQSFSIVGDFQQAIYAPRSDIATYRAVHEQLRVGPRGASSRLEVTFRCDTAIINFVNRVFPLVLNNSGGQARFETLVPRLDAGPGQVVRIACPDLPEQEEETQLKSAQLYEHEATFVAKRISQWGFAALGARSWSQVAILCPRKNWQLELQRALMEHGLRVQLHSSDETPRDRMPGAWLTALIWIAQHPEDSFEIAGVLREIFGISDSDMAVFTDGKGEKLRLDRPISDIEGPVASALKQLQNAITNATRKPLGQAVSHLVELTQLRERLHSIPEADAGDVDHELDDFLALIAARSAKGTTLSELAHDLRAGLAQTSPTEEEIHEDAIQMMTSHKSKGLEWDAVIVPYLFRRIEWKQGEYPRVVSLGADDAIICRDKTEYAERARDIVNARERQQCQRLYYVMLTRAKRTLVLLDDQSLMGRQRQRPGEIAGEFLQLAGGQNREFFLALPETLSLRPEAVVAQLKDEENHPNFPTLTRAQIEQAVARAADFPRRTTPHALAIHERHTAEEVEPEKRAEWEEDQLAPQPENPGILYGIWWHELVQTIPWQEPREHWQTKFAAANAHSPQPERSAREWDLFCRSKLADWLAQPGRLIQAEIPFLWRESEQSCLEGVMDLAVYSESESIWQIIDWKTNKIGPKGSDGLVETYRGQIEAYVRALRQMLSAEVRGSLYLTQSGIWVPVE